MASLEPYLVFIFCVVPWNVDVVGGDEHYLVTVG